MIIIMILRQFYERQKIDKIRWIYNKNNLANVTIMVLSNLVLKKIISTNKITIRLKR